MLPINSSVSKIIFQALQQLTTNGKSLSPVIHHPLLFRNHPLGQQIWIEYKITKLLKSGVPIFHFLLFHSLQIRKIIVSLWVITQSLLSRKLPGEDCKLEQRLK